MSLNWSRMSKDTKRAENGYEERGDSEKRNGLKTVKGINNTNNTSIDPKS